MFNGIVSISSVNQLGEFSHRSLEMRLSIRHCRFVDSQIALENFWLCERHSSGGAYGLSFGLFVRLNYIGMKDSFTGDSDKGRADIEIERES